MQKRWNWLLILWRREWDFWEKTLIRQLRLELIPVGAVFVLFFMSSALTNRFTDMITSAPAAVMAFWGVPKTIGTPDSLFFMKWILMPINVWIAWEACNRAMKTIWREEEGGQIYLLCNQWYTRYQIVIAKYSWIVLSFVLKYLVFAVVYICLALVTCKSGQRLAEWKNLTGLFGKGILVMILLISLSGCHAMLRKRKVWSVWADVVVLGTLAFCNLYKIRDLLELSMKQGGKDYTRLIRFLGWSKWFRGLAPLSWLNPFTEFGKGAVTAQIIVAVALTLLSATLGIVGYRIRKFS
jgi:hypothetical protein